jgi:tripartite-type tricarboxylate transporter receptor subunit TctC
VLAPARTPQPVISRLHGDILKVLQMPDTRNRLMSQGGDPVGNTPEQFAALIQEEITKWSKLIQAAKIKID